MAHESIFSFLKDDERFREIYLLCIDMEKQILWEMYPAATTTGRSIAECLIHIIAKTDEDLAKLFYFKDGKEQGPDFYNWLLLCDKNNLLNDPEIISFYHEVRIDGNNSVHTTNLSSFDYDSCLVTHKKVFTLCLECFSRFHTIDLEYYFDLDYLEDNISFTHEELINYINNIHENFVQVSDFLDYINNLDVFLPIDSFKNIMKDYNTSIIDLDDYNDCIDSVNFIDEVILERVIDNLNDDVADVVSNKINEINNNNFKDLKTFLSDCPNEYIPLEETEDYPLLNLLSKEYIKNRFSEIINRLKSIPVSRIDKNDRVIIESPFLKIVENENKISIEEDENIIKLNKKQEEAVTYNGDKPLVIDAGPGSGKTRVIIERVVHLIKEQKKRPSSILVITFTRKATEELRERFKNDTTLSINEINQMRISTIHSFCRHIISKYGDGPFNYLIRNGEQGLFILHNKEKLGLVGESFIYDNNVSDVIDAYNDYFNFNVDLDCLTNYIENEWEIDDGYYDLINEFYENNPITRPPPYNLIKSNNFGSDWHFARYLAVAKSYPKYIELLEHKKVCDNNYLIDKANALMEDDRILNDIPFNNILIDEFQDTDHNQKDLFDKLLIKKDLESFTVVGDADQSIYGWRGAYPDLFKMYADPNEGYNFEVITLEKNYRSTRDIVEFNEELIKSRRSLPKQLISNKKYGLPVYYLPNFNSDEESENIVSIIRTLKEDKKIKHYGDIALLFRTNEDVENIIKYLNNAGIPFFLKDKKDLKDQNEIKLILTLFWYLLPYKKYEFIPGNESYLNLYGFTDEIYKSSHILNLSKETRDILAKIQKTFDEKLLNSGTPNVNYHWKMSRDEIYREIFNLSNFKLDKIFENIDTYDLADLDEFDFHKLGITNRNDIDLFLKLKKLKSKINNKNLKNYEKLTTLEVFYELLNIIEFYDVVGIQKNKEAKRIKSNFALISEVIHDFESIVGKYSYKTLFIYLNNILSGYSCPIHDLDDNIDKVHIMTIHKSKGLEYPVVIMGSLKNEVKPFKKKKRFHTPIKCLEYKPDDDGIEDDNKIDEEYRVLYVGTTRAEELLILSSIDKRERPPSFLGQINKNFNRIRKLEPYNLSSISPIKSSIKRKVDKMFPELNFEEIMNDYLFCPVYYDIYDYTKFKNKYNDDNFTRQRLLDTLEKIFKSSNQDDFEIKKCIDETKRTFFIRDGDETAIILNKIPQFWEKYGQYYNPLKSVDMVIPGAFIMNNCDLHATLDLIIQEEDNNVSIVKFIPSDFKIERIINYYQYLLPFYGLIFKELGLDKKYNLKNIIVHSIKENHRYIVQYTDDNEEDIIRILNEEINKIVNEKFEKHRHSCDKCPYKDAIICKG